MNTRKKYSKEFKLDAISLVVDQGDTQKEAARSLDINVSMLGRWIREHGRDDGQAFRGNGKVDAGTGRDPAAARRKPSVEAGAKNPKGSDGLLRERNEVKYSFLTHREEVYPVSLMCRLLGVTRGGYYGHVSRQRNRPEDPVHRAMLDAVVEVARASDSTYGSRRMKRALNALGYLVSR